MPFRLQLTLPPGPEVRRCAVEELEDAARVLRAATAGEGDAAVAVHSARKGVKKTRSLLRLARPALGRKQYRRTNDALREAAGGLAATRDADVMLKTLRSLHEHAPGQLPQAAFDRLHAALTALRPAPAAEAGEDPLAIGAARLEAIAIDLGAWDLEDVGWDDLLDGFWAQYTRGREELLALLDVGGDAEAHHEWRKRVKDVWYHQRLLVEGWEPVLEASAEEAHRLSELLGDDHDLYVLREAIAGGRLDAAVDEGVVLELVEQRRADLLAAALPLGRRVFAETPKAARRRLGSYVGA